MPREFTCHCTPGPNRRKGSGDPQVLRIGPQQRVPRKHECSRGSTCPRLIAYKAYKAYKVRSAVVLDSRKVTSAEYQTFKRHLYSSKNAFGNADRLVKAAKEDSWIENKHAKTNINNQLNRSAIVRINTALERFIPDVMHELYLLLIDSIERDTPRGKNDLDNLLHIRENWKHADVASSNPRSGGNFRLIDCGKFWVRFSLRGCGFYASNRTLLGHQITPALVNSNQLL